MINLSEFSQLKETTPLLSDKRSKRSRGLNSKEMQGKLKPTAKENSGYDLLMSLIAFYEQDGLAGLQQLSHKDIRVLLNVASTCKSAYDYFLSQSDRPVFKLKAYPELSRFFNALLVNRQYMIQKPSGNPLRRSAAEARQRIAAVVDIGNNDLYYSQYAAVTLAAANCGVLAFVAMLFIYWNVKAVNHWANVVYLGPSETDITSHWSHTAEGGRKLVHSEIEKGKVIPDLLFSAFTGIGLAVGICALYGLYLVLRTNMALTRIPFDSFHYALELRDKLRYPIAPEIIRALGKNLSELEEWLSPIINEENVEKTSPTLEGDLSLVSFYGLFQPKKQAFALEQSDASPDMESYVLNV